MSLAIFDLDNTLIGGDSDNLWGQFLFDGGLIETAGFAEKNNQFYEDYKTGSLDIDAYLRFALGPLKGQSRTVLDAATPPPSFTSMTREAISIPLMSSPLNSISPVCRPTLMSIPKAWLAFRTLAAHVTALAIETRCR